MQRDNQSRDRNSFTKSFTQSQMMHQSQMDQSSMFLLNSSRINSKNNHQSLGYNQGSNRFYGHLHQGINRARRLCDRSTFDDKDSLMFQLQAISRTVQHQQHRNSMNEEIKIIQHPEKHKEIQRNQAEQLFEISQEKHNKKQKEIQKLQSKQKEIQKGQQSSINEFNMRYLIYLQEMINNLAQTQKKSLFSRFDLKPYIQEPNNEPEQIANEQINNAMIHQQINNEDNNYQQIFQKYRRYKDMYKKEHQTCKKLKGELRKIYQKFKNA